MTVSFGNCSMPGVHTCVGCRVGQIFLHSQLMGGLGERRNMVPTLSWPGETLATEAVTLGTQVKGQSWS